MDIFKLFDSVNHNAMRDKKQKRHRILLMIALVTMLFAFNWLPIHCIHLYFKFTLDFPIWNQSLYIFKAFAHTLTYTNSMLNPFFYTMMGRNFRKTFSSKRNGVSRLFSLTAKPLTMKGSKREAQSLL